MRKYFGRKYESICNIYANVILFFDAYMHPQTDDEYAESKGCLMLKATYLSKANNT